MSPSIKKVNNNSSSNNSGNMSYRRNQNRNSNLAGNYGGRGMMVFSPWENQNCGAGNIPGQNMNAQVLNLANNLLNNLVRNQNPPSLLDLPHGGGGGRGGGMGRQRGGQSSNRNMSSNINNAASGPVGSRRSNFQGRGSSGPGPRQGGGGITKQNASDRVKKVLAKNSNKKKDGGSGKKHEKPESAYADVPNDRFYCHLCKKHMWDAESFENHINGRNHLTIRESVEESYRVRANMIRQDVKLIEQIKSIEVSRLKGKNRNLDYCTMCDLNFHGHISAHRRSDGHLQLKKFLHPRCLECNKEFSTRIDYDTHLLSPGHLKKAAERNTKVGEERATGLQLITEQEEMKDVRSPQTKKKKSSKKSESEGGKKDGEESGTGGATGAAGDSGEGGETGGDGEENATAAEEADENKDTEDAAEVDESKEGDTVDDDEAALPVDSENCILDYKEGDTVPGDIDNLLPIYNHTRPVGTSFIEKLDCYECKLCGKFFDNEKTAHVHSRSFTHHRNFLKLINELATETKIAERRAEAAAAAQELKKKKVAEEGEKKPETDKRGGGDDKTKASAGAEKTNGNAAESELYDPSEATGDVDMAENGEENGEDAEAEAEDDMQAEDKAEEAKMEITSAPSPGKAETKVEKMDTQESSTPNETNSSEAVKEEPAKTEPAKTATKTTAAAPPAAEESPAKKATPARGQPARGMPGRGRGRGRYTRY